MPQARERETTLCAFLLFLQLLTAPVLASQQAVPDHLKALVQMQCLRFSHSIPRKFLTLSLLCTRITAFERVTQLFRLHGALPIETSLLAPKSVKMLDKANTACFLDPTGER